MEGESGYGMAALLTCPVYKQIVGRTTHTYIVGKHITILLRECGYKLTHTPQTSTNQSKLSVLGQAVKRSKHVTIR